MRSASSPRAVSMITGSSERARIQRQSSSPSTPGSMTSSTTRSGGSSRAADSPYARRRLLAWHSRRARGSARRSRARWARRPRRGRSSRPHCASSTLQERHCRWRKVCSASRQLAARNAAYGRGVSFQGGIPCDESCFSLHLAAVAAGALPAVAADDGKVQRFAQDETLGFYRGNDGRVSRLRPRRARRRQQGDADLGLHERRRRRSTTSSTRSRAAATTRRSGR